MHVKWKYRMYDCLDIGGRGTLRGIRGHTVHNNLEFKTNRTNFGKLFANSERSLAIEKYHRDRILQHTVLEQWQGVIFYAIIVN